MIVSRPKSNALFAIVVFLMICFSLGIVNLNILLKGGKAWYNYLIVVVTFGIGLSILFKQMIGFKIITVGEETFKVARPFLFSGYLFKVKNIEFWEETLIDTKNGQFKELTIAQDSGKKLKITLQENSNYKKIKDYLSKKAGKKQKRSN
jgi:hypothetical protein